MEIRVVTELEGTNRNGMVVGISTIDHAIRIKLKLSLEEYVLLDFIHAWNLKSEKPIRFSDYYSATGFINEEITQLFALLKEKALLVKDASKNRVDVSGKWKELFSTNATFDQLWSIHPKGNKNMARIKIRKALKKVSSEILIDKLKKYIEWCDRTTTFKKDLSTWLNPDLEHWNNMLVENNFQNPKKVTTNVKFKK